MAKKRTHKRGRKAPPRVGNSAEPTRSVTVKVPSKVPTRGLVTSALEVLAAAGAHGVEEEFPLGPIRRGAGKTGNPVVRRKVIGGLVYQLEFRQCGTSTCRCMKTSDPRAGWHGPYWYGYTSATRLGGESTGRGRWVSTYIGREFHELG